MLLLIYHLLAPPVVPPPVVAPVVPPVAVPKDIFDKIASNKNYLPLKQYILCSSKKNSFQS